MRNDYAQGHDDSNGVSEPPLQLLASITDDAWVIEQAIGFADENTNLWVAVIGEGLTRVSTVQAGSIGTSVSVCDKEREGWLALCDASVARHHR